MKNNDLLFDDIDGIYNYCPSIVKHRKNYYIYYCSNVQPFKIIDHIAFRSYNGISKKWSKKNIVLSPSSDGWDCVHTCDPSVVKCRINISGKIYKYLMAYLGCDTLDCTHNQVGLAFSNSLKRSFVKYKNNPVVPYDNEDAYLLWGTGQPSILCLDKKNNFLLSYTIKTRKEGTFTNIRHIRIEKDRIVLVNETKLPKRGLKLLDINDTIHNCDLAYYKNKIVMVRDTIEPWDKKYPNFIGSKLEVATTDMNFKQWNHIFTLTSDHTNSLRNHNAGIVRGLYGELLDSKLEMVYTNSIQSLSNEDLKYLWSYRLHYYKIK